MKPDTKAPDADADMARLDTRRSRRAEGGLDEGGVGSFGLPAATGLRTLSGGTSMVPLAVMVGAGFFSSTELGAAGCEALSWVNSGSGGTGATNPGRTGDIRGDGISLPVLEETAGSGEDGIGDRPYC